MYTADEALAFLERQAGEMEGFDPITYLSSEVAEAFDLSPSIYPGVSTATLNELAHHGRGAVSQSHYWSRVRPQLLEAAAITIEQATAFIESEAGPAEQAFKASAEREYAKIALANFREAVRDLRVLPDKPTQLQLKVCSLISQLNQDASLGALAMGTLWDSQDKLRRLTNEYLLKPSDKLLDSYMDHVLRYYANSWEVELADEDAAAAKAAQTNNLKLIAELETLRLLDECDL